MKPLVLIAHDIFKKIDEYFENDLSMEHTELIVDEVYEMLDSVYKPRLNSLNDTKEACNSLQLEIEEKEEFWNSLNVERESQGHHRGGRETVRHNYHAMDGSRPDTSVSAQFNKVKK